MANDEHEINNHTVQFLRGVNSTRILNSDGDMLVNVVGEVGDDMVRAIIEAYYRGWSGGRACGYDEAQRNMRKAIGIQ